MNPYKQSDRWQDVLFRHILPSEDLKIGDINDLSIYGVFMQCVKKCKKVKEGGSRTDRDIRVHLFPLNFESFHCCVL